MPSPPTTIGTSSAITAIMISEMPSVPNAMCTPKLGIQSKLDVICSRAPDGE